MKKTIATEILLYSTFLVNVASLTEQNLASVWIGLAWKRISFVGFQGNHCGKLMTIASQLTISTYCFDRRQKPLDYSVPIHLAENETNLIRYLEDSKLPAHRILYESHAQNFKQISTTLENLRLSKSFFILHLKHNHEFDVYNVQTFKDAKVVSMVKWKPHSHNVYFNEQFDLKGTTLKSSILSWPPYAKVGKCQIGSKKCQVSGIVPDVLFYLGRMFNFTLDFDKTSSGLWGTEKSNYTSVCQSFGQLHDISSGEYDISGAHWAIFENSTCLVDHSIPFLVSKPYLYINGEGKQDMDNTLFLRPFAHDAWQALAVILGLIFLIFTFEKLSHLHGVSRLIQTLFWILFMLVHAYYTGAMTMFFSEPSKLPFTNIPDAAKRFPEWKPVLLSGSERYFKEKLPNHLSNTFIDQMSTYNLFKSDISEVMKYIEENTKTYTLTDKFVVLYELSKRQYNIDFESFENGKAAQSGLIATKFSPYTRMFNKGIQQISENGVLSSFIKSKLRDLESSQSPTGNVTLGWHHLAPVFLFYMAILIIIPGFVFIEMFHNSFKRKTYNFDR